MLREVRDASNHGERGRALLGEGGKYALLSPAQRARPAAECPLAQNDGKTALDAAENGKDLGHIECATLLKLSGAR